MSIPRRPLGRTGLQVSVIGFGASPLGGVFEEVDEDVGIAAVHEAFNAGINIFDTSPFYGSTRSETVLGKALKGLPRNEIVVATKVGRYGPDEFDFSAERVCHEFQRSLQRLQLEYVDILQCHDIEFGDLDQVASETIPALLRLKEAGLARHIGVTGLPLAVYRHVLGAVAPGTLDLCLSYCHYCLNDTTLLTLMDELQAQALGVINASCLSMGLLTTAGPPGWHPAPPELKAAAKEAASFAVSQGHDVSTLALKWALKEPRIATTLVGMASPDVVRRNVLTTLQALQVVEDPEADAELKTLQRIMDILAPVKDVTWPSGRPENN